jgi:hypothetical protein
MRFGVRTPAGARNFLLSRPVQTGPGAHPASCTMGTGSLPGVKRPGYALTTHPNLAPNLEWVFDFMSWGEENCIYFEHFFYPIFPHCFSSLVFVYLNFVCNHISNYRFCSCWCRKNIAQLHLYIVLRVTGLYKPRKSGLPARDLRFVKQRWWRFKYSGTWSPFDWWLVSDTSQELSAFIFIVRAVKWDGNLLKYAGKYSPVDMASYPRTGESSGLLNMRYIFKI